MFAEIVAAINSIGELVKIIKSLFDFIKENREKTWFKESGEVFSKLSDPGTTVEEKREAAKKIRELINSL